VSDSLESFASTWTLFCVGCNERFPVGKPGEPCPSCGRETSADASLVNETVVLSDEDEHKQRGVAHYRSDSDPLIGQQFHVYQCVSLLGSGGMGRVYLATHNDLHRRCALKLLSPKRAKCDQDFVDRFMEEGRAAASLIHPNIVTIHAVGENHGKHFLEMEFISGRSLQEMIRDQGAMPVTRALSLAAQTAEGLAAAHREGIIHRDVKPDNIMLNRHGVPKVSDFGLAKRVLDGRGKPVSDGLCGTPNFMAPELFAGQPATPSSDVYALGVCLYFMLVGKMPYRAKSIADLRWQVTTERVPNIRDLSSAFSLEVASVLARMTDPTPGNRPVDAVEASQLIHAVLGHERDLESLLLQAFRNEVGVTWKRDADERYIITRELSGGRSQRVFLEPSSHDVNERLLLFYSICCPADPSYYEQALRLNSEMQHGSLAIREYDGQPYFVVVNTYPRSTVDPEEIHATILEMAVRADHVEHQLTGQDNH